MTLLQVAVAWAVREAPWWKVLVAAYVVGGTASQNLFTAQHELSHFLAFRTPLYNKVLSIVSNCPLVVPTATSFRKYHQEHHSHLVRPCPVPWRVLQRGCALVFAVCACAPQSLVLHSQERLNVF